MSASFDSFKSSLAGDVLQPGDDGYEQGIKRWSPTGIRQAQYVVYPKTTNDIAAALKFVQENNIDVAICGGGHSWSVRKRKSECSQTMLKAFDRVPRPLLA